MNTKFGTRLKELRNQNNLTQLELSKILDVSKSNISKYESGDVEPNIELIHKMSNYFDVTTDYLLGKSSHPQLSRRNELDIEKDIANMEENIRNGSLRLSLEGEELDDEIVEFLIESYKNTIVLAKIKAKEKFTPKKYKQDENKED